MTGKSARQKPEMLGDQCNFTFAIHSKKIKKRSRRRNFYRVAILIYPSFE